MAHEKVHVICENLCLEEGMTKEEIETQIETGEEFATNEYVDGHRVYGKRITTNLSDSSNVVNVNHGISGLRDGIKYEGTIEFYTNENEKRTRFIPSSYHMGLDGDPLYFLISIYEIGPVWFSLVYGGFYKTQANKFTVNITLYYTKND